MANTAIGAVSFLALEAIGGSITINYGFVNATAAILIVGALDLSDQHSDRLLRRRRYGVDIDLLTRGAGFGYIGSTITSLIYASFTFLFFAIEAAIMSLALEMCFGIPLFIGYIISSLVVIPLVTHGITLHQPLSGCGRSRSGSSCICCRSSSSPSADTALVRAMDAVFAAPPKRGADDRSTSSCSARPRPSCSR